MRDYYFSYQTKRSIDTWETALYEAASDALHRKVMSAIYLKDIVDAVLESKTVFVMNDQVVLFHARPSEHVRKEFIAYMHVNNGVGYFDKTLHHVFVFGARDEALHIVLLKTLTRFVMEASTDDKLYRQDRMRSALKQSLKSHFGGMPNDEST